MSSNSKSKVSLIKKMFDSNSGTKYNKLDEHKYLMSSDDEVSAVPAKKPGKVSSLTKLFNSVIGPKKLELHPRKKKLIIDTLNAAIKHDPQPATALQETSIATGKPKPAWVVGDRKVHISKDIENKWDSVKSQMQTMFKVRNSNPGTPKGGKIEE